MPPLVVVCHVTCSLPSCEERAAGLDCLATSFPCSLLLKLPSSPHTGDTRQVCFALQNDCHEIGPITFTDKDVDTPHQRMWLANLRVGGQINTTPEAAYAGLPSNYDRMYQKMLSMQGIGAVLSNI